MAWPTRTSRLGSSFRRVPWKPTSPTSTPSSASPRACSLPSSSAPQRTARSSDGQINRADDTRLRVADERYGVHGRDRGAVHQYGHHVLAGKAEADRRVDVRRAFDHHAEPLDVGPL